MYISRSQTDNQINLGRTKISLLAALKITRNKRNETPFDNVTQTSTIKHTTWISQTISTLLSIKKLINYH